MEEPEHGGGGEKRSAVMLSKNDSSGLGHVVVTPLHDITKSS